MTQSDFCVNGLQLQSDSYVQTRNADATQQQTVYRSNNERRHFWIEFKVYSAMGTDTIVKQSYQEEGS